MPEAARYRRISADEYRHVWVVGDLHGCYSLLMMHLAAEKFDERCDLLISVGDLIDRGPDSAACLALLEEPWFTSVLGNHEQMALTSLQGDDSTLWINNGGAWYFTSTAIHKHSLDRLIVHTAKLPHIIEVAMLGRRYVIAHADYPLETYGYGQVVNVEDVVWGRRRLMQSQAGIIQRIHGADRFIFGHTPLEKVSVFANQIYIDTGAVYGGQLTLLRLR